VWKTWHGARSFHGYGVIPLKQEKRLESLAAPGASLGQELTPARCSQGVNLLSLSVFTLTNINILGLYCQEAASKVAFFIFGKGCAIFKV
jgi:hypothetical protein